MCASAEYSWILHLAAFARPLAHGLTIEELHKSFGFEKKEYQKKLVYRNMRRSATDDLPISVPQP